MSFACAAFVNLPRHAILQVFAKQEFDGTLNDSFCCGVILFMMLTGAPPWSAPTTSDRAFEMIVVKRDLRKLVSLRGFLGKIREEALDLLERLLCYESQRFSVDAILKHPWLTGSEDSSK